MVNNRIIKNTIWLILGNIFRLAISFVTGILVTRYLGPEKYGIINYVAAYTTLVSCVCAFGINGVAVHLFTNNAESDVEILGSYIAIRFFAGLFSSVSLMLLIYIIEHGNTTYLLVAILQAIQFLFLTLDSFKYWFQWKLLSKNESKIIIIVQLVVALYKIILIFLQSEFYWFALGISIDVALSGFLYIFLFKKNSNSPKLRFSKKYAKEIIKNSPPFIIASLMVVLYGKMDTIMIKNLLNSNVDVGLYNAALAITGYISFIPTAITDSVRPAIMDRKKNNSSEYQQFFINSVAIVVWIMIAYSVLCCVFGSFIIGLLYGEAYLGAISTLKILVWYTSFSYLGVMKNIWLVCENKSKYIPLISAMGTLTNLVLNFVMIPLFGITGAAIATLVTQIATNFIYMAIFPQTRGFCLIAFNAFALRGVKIKNIVSLIGLKTSYRS